MEKKRTITKEEMNELKKILKSLDPNGEIFEDNVEKGKKEKKIIIKKEKKKKTFSDFFFFFVLFTFFLFICKYLSDIISSR